MESRRGPLPSGQRAAGRIDGRGRWIAGLSGAVGVLTALLFCARSGLAQGNPVLVLRQMQSRIASLTAQIQRQQQQISVMNNERRSQQQQWQQLQNAVNAAAAAGDPMALAIRSPNVQTMQSKLITQLEARARKQPVAGGSDQWAADLSGARLSGAALQGSKLAKVNLRGADLTHADLTHAVLSGADLQGAKLQGANLTAVDLANANLTGALYDSQTHWPTGFDPSQHGALDVK